MMESGTVGEESTKADTRKAEWPISLLGTAFEHLIVYFCQDVPNPKSEAQDAPKSKGFLSTSLTQW